MTTTHIWQEFTRIYIKPKRLFFYTLAAHPILFSIIYSLLFLQREKHFLLSAKLKNLQVFTEHIKKKKNLPSRLLIPARITNCARRQHAPTRRKEKRDILYPSSLPLRKFSQERKFV